MKRLRRPRWLKSRRWRSAEKRAVIIADVKKTARARKANGQK